MNRLVEGEEGKLQNRACRKSCGDEGKVARDLLLLLRAARMRGKGNREVDDVGGRKKVVQKVERGNQRNLLLLLREC